MLLWSGQKKKYNEKKTGGSAKSGDIRKMSYKVNLKKFKMGNAEKNKT